MASLEYRLKGSLKGTSGGIPYVFSYVVDGFIKVITETIRKWFHFPSTASI